ncbi:MAG: MarR family winged helix-turn-helix transcriptional regulator, partial [Acidimicrobiia bacterium]
AQYRRLLELRHGLRVFLRWSADRAREAGLTPSQHQLLLAVRGHPHPDGPTVGDLAGHLVLRHHSTVELIDRCAAAGLVERVPDTGDSRSVRVHLTGAGAERLARLSELHLAELGRLAPRMAPIWAGLEVSRPEG